MGGFAQRHGLAGDAEVGFDTFVEAISDEHPDLLDAHWRPQHLYLAYPFIRPNFVGHLETMDADLQRVLAPFLGRGAERIEPRSSHRTAGRDTVAEHLFDPATLRRVRDLYGGDFGSFGYSRDLTWAREAPHQADFQDHDHPALATFGRPMAARARAARLQEVADVAGDTDDLLTCDWLMASRIETGPESTAALRLVRANRAAVISGCDVLLRAAAEAAAARWQLLRTIAAAGLSDQDRRRGAGP